MKISIYTFFLIILTSCHFNKETNDKEKEVETEVRTKTEQLGDKISRIKDEEWSEIKTLFSTSEKVFNPKELAQKIHTDIPISVKAKYKTSKFFDFGSEVFGLLYKIECIAGGFCERKELLIIKKNVVTERIEVGHEYADYGGTDMLTTEIKENLFTFIRLKIENVKTETDELKEITVLNDTIKKKLNLSSGKIEN